MRREKGITLLESIVTLAIIGVVATGLTAVFFESTRSTQISSDRMMAVQQVEAAGYRLSQDAKIAEGIAVLNYPDLIEFSWTEWDLNDGSSIYYTSTYSFTNMIDGVGKLQRTYWSSAGDNAVTTVGEYLYYDAGDPGSTTFALVQGPLLTVQTTSRFNNTLETRVFQVAHRVNL